MRRRCLPLLLCVGYVSAIAISNAAQERRLEDELLDDDRAMGTV